MEQSKEIKKKWIYMMDRDDYYSVSQSVMDSFKPKLKYADAMEMSAAWSLGKIAESDFSILYALAVLKVASINTVMEFLGHIKKQDDGPLVQNITKETLIQAMRRLYDNGFVYEYTYRNDDDHTNIFDVKLYSIHKLSLSALNSRQTRNIKMLDFREMRPAPEVIGSAASAFVGMELLKQPAISSYEDSTVFRSRNRSLGTVMYDMELKSTTNNTRNFIAIEHFYSVYDKIRFSEESFFESIEMKLQWATDYIKMRSMSRNGESRGEAYVVFVLRDFKEEMALFNSVISNPSKSEWRANINHIYFTSSAAVEMAGDIRYAFATIMDYRAGNTEDGNIRYTPGALDVGNPPFI